MGAALFALISTPMGTLMAQPSPISDTISLALLTGQPWCQEQGTVTSAAPGQSVRIHERAQFRADGSVSLQAGNTATLSMGGMSMSSQSWRSENYRWRVEPGLLWLSRDGGLSWTSGAFSLQQDGTGPLMTIDGAAYRPCR
jgi:photosystem II stability/assembly factor-like uncharacterized protein